VCLPLGSGFNAASRAFKTHKKDHHSAEGLLSSSASGAGCSTTLKGKDSNRYKKLLQERRLGIRK